jgi:WD40 repeat protein/tetratricopeptide (TPR) repeat protein
MVPFDTRTAYHDECIPTFSPDGRFLTAGSNPHGIVLWDLDVGKPVLQRPAPFEIQGLSFSPDSKRVAIVERDLATNRDKINFYRLPTGQLEHFIELVAARSVAFSPDGDRIAIAANRVCQIHDSVDGEILARIELSEDPIGAALAWSPSGDLLATSVSNQILVWDIPHLQRDWENTRNGAGVQANSVVKPLCTLTGHEAQVDRIVFNPAHEFMLISSSWDSTTRLWNVFSGEEQLLIAESKPMFSADGSLLSISSPSQIDLYTVLHGDACQWICRNETSQVVFGPESDWIAATSEQGIRFWSLPMLRPIARIGPDWGAGLSWDSHRNSLLMGNELGVFEVPVRRFGTEVLNLGPARQLLTTSRSAFTDIQCSSDGRWLSAIEVGDWEQIVMDRDSNRSFRLHRPQRSFVKALSPEGGWIALQLPEEVEVFDLVLGRTIFSRNGEAVGLGINPNGRALAIATHGELTQFETDQWQKTGVIAPIIRIRSPAWSADGEVIGAPKGAGVVGLFCAADGKTLAELEYPDPPRLFWNARFSADQSLLAITHEKSITVWNLCLIRDRLTEMGLDWNLSDTLKTDVKDEIKRVEFDSGDIGKLTEIVGLTENLPRHELGSALEDWSKLDFDLPDIHMFRGWSAEANGDYETACQNWQRATAMAPYAEQWQWDYSMCLLQSLSYEQVWPVLFSMASPERSQRASASFQQLCYLSSAHPNVVSDQQSWQALLDRWTDALEGADTNSSFAVFTSGLSDDVRSKLWEAVGMARYGCGEYERAKSILERHLQRERFGGNYVLADLHARMGELEKAEMHYDKAESHFRTQTQFEFTKVHLHLYDPIRNRVLRSINDLKSSRIRNALLKSDGITEELVSFASTGRFDSVELGRAATAKFGRISVRPTGDGSVKDGITNGNLMFWELHRPGEEIQFRLPVPGAGRYRMSARLVASPHCGDFEVAGEDEGEAHSFSLYFSSDSVEGSKIELIEGFELGEFEAAETNASENESTENQSDSGWTVTLVLRSTGRHENATQFSLIIDEILWRRID